MNSFNGVFPPTDLSFGANLLGLSDDNRFYDEHPDAIKDHIDEIARALLDPDNGHAIVLGLQSVGKSFLIEQFAGNTHNYLANSNLDMLYLIDVSRSDANMIESIPSGVKKYVEACAENLKCGLENLCLVTESPDFAAAIYSYNRKIKVILELNSCTFAHLYQREQQGVSKIWSSWGIIDASQIFLKRDELVDSLESIMIPKLEAAGLGSLTSSEIGGFVDYALEIIPELEYISEVEEENKVILVPPGLWGLAIRRLGSNLAYSSRKKYFNEDGSTNLEALFEDTLSEVYEDFDSFLKALENDGDDMNMGIGGATGINLEDAMIRVFHIGSEPERAAAPEKKKELKPLVFSDTQTLSSRLKATVLGQDQAVESVTKSLAVPAAGLHDDRKPLRSFLFLGPTGVGKTQLALSLAEEVCDEPMNVIRLDMSEYAREHEASKLLGAPSGYVGYEEGGVLTNAVLQNPRSLVLLDEVEKAHHKIWDSFLQILDAGRMTDNKGREIDFSQTIIVMTSNLGARETANGSTGFSLNADPATAQEKARKAVEAEVEKFFRPEFINRIDEMVFFNPLSLEIARKIVRREIGLVAERMKASGFKLSAYEDDLVDEIINKSHFSKYGARDIQRAVFKSVSEPLAIRLLNTKKKTKTIKLSLGENSSILVK